MAVKLLLFEAKFTRRGRPTCGADEFAVDRKKIGLEETHDTAEQPRVRIERATKGSRFKPLGRNTLSLAEVFGDGHGGAGDAPE